MESMTDLASLWLPILAAGIVVFIASSVIHMALPWHKSDYPGLPNEDALLAALRPLGLTRGDYMAPRCAEMKEFKSPEFQAKLAAGPVVLFTVLPNGAPSMGRNLSQWFVYCLIVSLFSAHLAGLVASGGAGAAAAHVAGVTAFIGYTLALFQMSIWYGRSWRATLFTALDGVIYAVLTGLVFSLLWPHAGAA
jgi:hypothetical protein